MSNANPAVLTIAENLGATVTRQRLSMDGALVDSIVYLRQAAHGSMGVIGTPGLLSDSEATVRGLITTMASQPWASSIKAILGPNEVDSISNGTRDWGTNWAQDSVRFCSWVYDEVRNGGHASLNGCLVGGAVLKHNGVPLESDVAELAAARFNGLSMNAVSDVGDWHHYAGANGPGFRMDGRDANGNRPAGIVLGSDGKCSTEHFEMQRFRQIYGNPSKQMLHTEWGWPSSQPTTDAQAALLAQETYLRDYNLGVPYSCYYELIDQYPQQAGDERYFGAYVVTSNPLNPAGPKPVYTKLQTLFGYSGSQSFTGVGWVAPKAASTPAEVGVNVFSKGGGGWDWYLLREADSSAEVVVTPGHSVAGRTPTNTDAKGNRHYTVAFGSSTMVVLAVT